MIIKVDSSMDTEKLKKKLRKFLSTNFVARDITASELTDAMEQVESLDDHNDSELKDLIWKATLELDWLYEIVTTW